MWMLAVKVVSPGTGVSATVPVIGVDMSARISALAVRVSTGEVESVAVQRGVGPTLLVLATARGLLAHAPRASVKTATSVRCRAIIEESPQEFVVRLRGAEGISRARGGALRSAPSLRVEKRGERWLKLRT